MNNYWLTEYGDIISVSMDDIEKAKKQKSYNQADDSEEPEDEMPEEDPEDVEDADDPENKLNPRQKMMYDHYEHLVEMFGKFDQTAKANGAHYAPSKLNPFIKQGMVCSNCVFFMGGQGCEIVAGKIESNAICKLWIIPEDLIVK